MEKNYTFALVKNGELNEEQIKDLESWMVQAPVGIQTLTITNDDEPLEATPL